MSSGYFESDYEEAFLAVLNSLGWQSISGDELHRKYTDTLLYEDLHIFLEQRYPDLTPNELERVIFNLSNTKGDTDYLSLRETALLYLNGFNFRRDDQSLPDLSINYIDFENPKINILRAVNQLTIREHKAERRPDILLFVNGIPLCILELKSPSQQQATIFDAWEQIHVRYKRDIPSFMRYCLLSIISDGGSTRLGTTYTPFEHYYAWKKVEAEEEIALGLGEMQALIKGALAPERFLEIIRDFVYFPDFQVGQQKEKEIVCRYPQFFAVKKLYGNILKHIRTNGGDGKGGTYFGATGSGKTYTMLFLARYLKKHTNLNPTILIIVDREDLETQAAGLFESSKEFLGDDSVKSFNSRNDLKKEFLSRKTGGVFITTVQKFCETTGFLSNCSNIICFSDEAHRSQLNLGETLEINNVGECADECGAFVKFGFAQYLRDAFPNATFVGFSGTPIVETVQVFGPIVDKYTMRQAVADGITVPLKYEARLARIVLDTKKAHEIEEYYSQCEKEGTDAEKVESSRRAMSRLEVILGDDDRLDRMAKDIAMHYESYVAEHAGTISKAMIVSSTRAIAYRLYEKLKVIKPEWFMPKRVVDESSFDTPEKRSELEEYKSLPMVNMVATRGSNDPKDMFELLGDKDHRKMLDREFKKELSNFQIAIVVDMWITGFDVPSLAILYNDKPLQRHTLIQTISRVNRKNPGKEYGLIVDYIGIRENMQKALKQFGGDDCIPPDTEITYAAFADELQILKEMLHEFDASDFFLTEPLPRLLALQRAAEFVLAQPPLQKDSGISFSSEFKEHVSRLRSAFSLLQPAGRLNKEESAWAHFFMAVQAINGKTTNSRHSVETMNRFVENMVSEALQCTGVETVLNAEGEEELFSEKFMDEVEKVKLPHTKFQLLVKSLKKAIREYGRTNQLKAQRFDERLLKIIDKYNTRDKLVFANKVASTTISAIQGVVNQKLDELTNEVIELFKRLRKDREEFKRLGITFEEKAFYDILVDQRDVHGFEYADSKCLALAQKIKLLIDNSAVYADWMNNENLRADLQAELTILLYQEGYPPEWDEEVFTKVMEQVRNFKTYNM